MVQSLRPSGFTPWYDASRFDAIDDRTFAAPNAARGGADLLSAAYEASFARLQPMAGFQSSARGGFGDASGAALVLGVVALVSRLLEQLPDTSRDLGALDPGTGGGPSAGDPIEPAGDPNAPTDDGTATPVEPGNDAGNDAGNDPGAIADPMPGGGPEVPDAAAVRARRDLAPRQFGGDLRGVQQESGCGPIAAIGLARAKGMDPDVQETFRLASSVGWGPDGMGGPGNYVRLLEKLGIEGHLEYGVNRDKIRSDVEAGHPVTISTARHYFLANDYDPDTGRYYVGTTGTALRGGKEWMTLDEINRLGDGINGVIYA